ncbi:uncharacterized protein F5147DRAFT_677473 [Suillus discolor]|uniref:Uncharacterized protein n=1 Tax=Suillus discolor TaxID=1912936 RepID=A0A9P7FF88_9AGAM|nr:uncharacterized protein F5147DRAFT_677473 [Suillus discolor]KAG2114624.1 hypothetical protein F5147DRAFT_677473 [Suillus discolor]
MAHMGPRYTGTPWLFLCVTAPFDPLFFCNPGTLVHIDLLTGLLLYITARAILLVLMFTTLRHLPGDACQAVSWIGLVPHL